MPKRKGPRGLKPAQVKAIFLSRQPTKDVAKKFRVSQNLVYLIQARRIHKDVTEGIRAPRRARRRGRAGGAARMTPLKIDMRRLADEIVKRLLKHLRRAV